MKSCAIGQRANDIPETASYLELTLEDAGNGTRATTSSDEVALPSILNTGNQKPRLPLPRLSRSASKYAAMRYREAPPAGSRNRTTAV
jgi:hypothetical protein